MKNKDNIDENYQDSKKIRQACLKLLTRREHSQKEIQQKLAIKGYDHHKVVAVIDELAEQHWQDDARYAESYARFRSQKGFGPVRIGYELRQQGVDQSTVDKILETTSDDWMSLLEQIYNKKYQDSEVMDNKEKAKRIQFLLQRGFSSTMINALFE